MVAEEPTAPEPTGEPPATRELALSELTPQPETRGTEVSVPAKSDASTRTFPPLPAEAAPPVRLQDFELIRMLGEGAFAQVYLARQISLDRLVALKITDDYGSEPRILASLEHDFIVRVFSVSVDAQKKQRLLCMQYVPGTTMAQVIRRLYQDGAVPESGLAILQVIDASNNEPVAFDLAPMRDRTRLEQADFIEAACWLGARLAEALAFAHSRGVLHCDIKPANILINRYGRPLLADFNVAVNLGPAKSTEIRVGGTLPYMSPEHIEAFLGGAKAVVDERSDLYSLGLVLYELLTGRQPFDAASRGVVSHARLQRLAAERRATIPAPRQLRPTVPEILDRVIRRCLAPAPEQRFQKGAELARALEGCLEMRRCDRELPAPGPLTRAAIRHPFLIGMCLFFLPHVLGSIVNISYNAVRIIHDLTEAQQQAFAQMTLGYNLVVYSICGYIIVRLIVPILRTWRELRGGGLPERGLVEAVRRRALSLPAWTVGLSFLGWFPGALLFPLYLHERAGPVDFSVFVHFITSFAISGLIALTYAVFAVQFVVVRVLYPGLWSDPRDFHAIAQTELGRQGRRLWLWQLLAGLIPLAGAVLMVDVGPEAIAGYRTFRVLVTALIGLGMAGFGLALWLSHFLNHALLVLMGKDSGATGSKAATS